MDITYNPKESVKAWETRINKAANKLTNNVDIKHFTVLAEHRRLYYESQVKQESPEAEVCIDGELFPEGAMKYADTIQSHIIPHNGHTCYSVYREGELAICTTDLKVFHLSWMGKLDEKGPMRITSKEAPFVKIKKKLKEALPYLHSVPSGDEQAAIHAIRPFFQRWVEEL